MKGQTFSFIACIKGLVIGLSGPDQRQCLTMTIQFKVDDHE